MEDLSQRQKQILARVIECYIRTTLPVGSQTLVEQYDLSLSPATLRYEMGNLEVRGYLTHPHTSAGRIPTDRGYRFYVRELVTEEPPSESLLELISREMRHQIENLESFIERSSRVLSAMAEETVLVISPELAELYFKEINLVPLDPARLLAVWCSTSGLVQNCVVEIGSPLSHEEVRRIQNFINQELSGEPMHSLEEALRKRVRGERDSLRRLYEETLHIVHKSMVQWEEPRVFVEGSRYILNQPEFQDVKKFQRLITTLEEKSSLVDLLKHRPSPEGIHVAIGEKELSSDIWDCALVSAPYLLRGRRVGMLGILGPRRMPYGRMMGLAHRMADEITRALDRWGS